MNVISLGNQRFLYPQHQPAPVPGPGPSVVAEEDDGLGVLPSGWERRVQPEGECTDLFETLYMYF